MVAPYVSETAPHAKPNSRLPQFIISADLMFLAAGINWPYEKGMRAVWRVGGLLVLIWALAAATIFWARASRTTPAALSAYIKNHPLEGLTHAQRAKVIADVADQLNALDYDQRQELRKAKSDRRIFEQMTQEERKRFLKLTLPEGFRQLMLALNKMKPEQRKKIVERALNDMEEENPGARDRIDREMVRTIISQGMEAFYQQASADVKLDFAPVIEQLQRNTQRMR